MKKKLLICLLLILVMILSAGCGKAETQSGNVASALPTEAITEETLSSNETGPLPEEPAVQEEKLILSVNGKALEVSWEQNKTVAALIVYAQNENITVDTALYGGFEQVGSLPQGFLRDDVQMTTLPGDIVLYAGNQLVLFFGSNTWSYTMLGHIEGFSENELSQLLGEPETVVEIKLN